MLTFDEALKQMQANDPPIEIGEVWVAKNTDGAVLRRLRILALYPSNMEKTWIYEELPSKMNRTGFRRIETCPEFNLRYVFEREGKHASA